MNLIESNNYKKDIKKKLKGNQLILTKLSKFIFLLISMENMEKLMASHLRIQYNIESKGGRLKHLYSVRINGGYRLIFKPIGEYPYQLIKIDEIELTAVNNHDYKSVERKI